MNIKLIDNPLRLAEFLNDSQNTGRIVEPGEHYRIKPDALYPGIYEGVMLTGVHEVRPFWLGVVECHAIYAPDFRGAMRSRGIASSVVGCWKIRPLPTVSPWYRTPQNMAG